MCSFKAVLISLMVAGAAIAGNTWQIEKIDAGGPGKFSSMKIDNEGNVHLIYVLDDREQNPVRYAFWDHSLKRWFIMTIASHGSICSLILDSKQRPHIAYVDAGSQPGAKLYYGYWNGTVWNIQPVKLNAEIIAYYASIALDAQDNPSISYYEYTGPTGAGLRVRMRVVSWNGKYWAVETVDGDNQSGKFNSLAIDSKGHKHLAYANVNGMTAGIRYGFWDGESWHREILEGLPSSQTYIGYAACIALDRQDNPHISYSHYAAPFFVKHAVRSNGRWKIEVVDQLAGVGYPDRNGITLDENGEVYMSYFDAGRGTLKFAHQEGGKWAVETVDEGGVGFSSSVQVFRGTVWISYADEARGGLKVARRTLTPLADASVTAAPSTASKK